MCGMRTGLAEPLRNLRPLSDVQELDERDEPETIAEIDEEGDDIVIGPPVERLPAEPIPAAYYPDHYEETEKPKPETPVVRNLSLRSMMLGTALVAACLGLGRVSMFAGVVSFLILVPAYVRTLSAISYYRQAHRTLGRPDIAAIFATSLVLSLMGLAAGGLVFLLMTVVSGLVVEKAGWEDPVRITTFVGAAAAFVTVLVLVHKVWPVNED
jgi:hypothetical protein